MPFHRGRIAGAEPYDWELRRRLDEEPDRLQRQLIILEWFFARFDTHLDRRHVMRYEDLVQSGGSLLGRGGSWTRFYRPSDLEKAAEGIRRRR